MKRMVWGALAAVGITYASTALAGNVDNAHLTFVRVTGDVLVLVVAEAVNSPPSCSSYMTQGRGFAVDLTTEGGKEIARLATAAFLAGRPVKVSGDGTCNLHGNKEDLRDFYLK